MDVSDFDFDLPPELIAQRPAPRGTSRLMALPRRGGPARHLSVADLPALLVPGDVLVMNDTKVIPARLFGTDEAGRRVEVLLTRRLPAESDGEETWECLAKPGRRVRPGRRLVFEEGLSGRVTSVGSDGRVTIAFSGPLDEHLERIGTAPLPPYIHRPEGRADASDRRDYQTVYAREPGAIAAPTAGLHLTPEILEAISARGAALASLTLHVGLGTFKPVRASRVEEHAMEPERGVVPEETARLVNTAKGEGRRVVAVGTTTVRTLEASARAGGGRVAAGPIETDLFLTPGAEFRVVDALLTNFHLPRSTLLMLVSAFAGRERILAAYREAVALGYRFFSYGDAMLIAQEPVEKILSMTPDRDSAWTLLCEFTKGQPLRRHALAVEATMRHLAKTSGVAEDGEIATWGIVGMLHDFDYERYPTEADHVWRGMEILRERAWPEEIVLGVGGHAFYTGIERKTPMQKAILAADELTGFVGACALVRPSKRIADVPVESVLKRLKEKSFARSVDRTYVTRGAEEWGLPVPELVALVLAAQVPIARTIGLDGAPADDLPDVPTPPPPPAP